MTIETTTETTPRPRPPARARPRPATRATNGHETSDSKLDRLLELVEHQGARIAALESGQVRFVESTPEPRPVQRVADPRSLPAALQKMLERTHDVPANFEAASRGPNYNYPLRLYLKPDGTVVSLQGDPSNRAMYTDKGFYCLSDDEAKQYREVEYPKILTETRRKAHLISTIRKMFLREPSLIGFREDPDYDGSLNVMSVAQLEDEWDDLRARSINPGQKLPPLPRFRSDTERPDAEMAGVDTRPPSSVRPAGHRDLEVTPMTARQNFEQDQQAHREGVAALAAIVQQEQRERQRLREVTPQNANQFA